jgi:4-diphosphocytidyl-2-C-methyl-D-erythritol kinase
VTKIINIQAPAKLNLFLHVLGRREDGYHNIQTAFQIIDLHDNLSVTVNTSGNITIETRNASIDENNNLVYKAASILKQHTSLAAGCHIQLEKNIPIGAGLGGGSSDAASTLLTLNKLWDIHLSTDQLCKIGAQLGADIPVFIHGHSAFAEGIGDIFTSLSLPQKYYVVINPKCQINTKMIYQHPELPRNSRKINPEKYHIGMGYNDFETLAGQLEPEILAALNWLNQYAPARLTGSGACIFAPFDHLADATNAAAQTPSRWQAFTTKGLNHAPTRPSVDQY